LESNIWFSDRDLHLFGQDLTLFTRFLLCTGNFANVHALYSVSPYHRFSVNLDLCVTTKTVFLSHPSGLLTRSHRSTKMDFCELKGAILTDNLPMLKLLLERRASMAAPGRISHTALTHAAFFGRLSIFKWLVQKFGAPVSEVDGYGYTAQLRAATISEHPFDTVAWLLEYGGANIVDTTSEGQTIWDLLTVGFLGLRGCNSSAANDGTSVLSSCGAYAPASTAAGLPRTATGTPGRELPADWSAPSTSYWP
jgi:hypothetical protein